MKFLIALPVIFIAIISYAIINYMNCGHEGSCGDHSLETTIVGSEDGDLLWELKYEAEVDAIIDIIINKKQDFIR